MEFETADVRFFHKELWCIAYDSAIKDCKEISSILNIDRRDLIAEIDCNYHGKLRNVNGDILFFDSKESADRFVEYLNNQLLLNKLLE